MTAWEASPSPVLKTRVYRAGAGGTLIASRLPRAKGTSMRRVTRLALPTLVFALAAVALAQPKQPEFTPEEKAARELMTARVGLAPVVVLPGGATATENEAFEKKFDARVSATLHDRTGAVRKVLPDSGPVFA